MVVVYYIEEIWNCCNHENLVKTWMSDDFQPSLNIPAGTAVEFLVSFPDESRLQASVLFSKIHCLIQPVLLVPKVNELYPSYTFVLHNELFIYSLTFPGQPCHKTGKIRWEKERELPECRVRLGWKLLCISDLDLMVIADDHDWCQRPTINFILRIYFRHSFRKYEDTNVIYFE